MASRTSRSVKIGFFVFVGFVLSTIAVFLIGDNRRAWDRKVVFHAKFGNVAGLRTGASVRMAGLDVGVVGRIGYEKDDDTRLDVALEVARKEAGRVLVGSRVVVSGRGLLGDKMVEILPPDPEHERDALAKIPGWNRPAPEGAVLRAPDEPSDIGAAVTQAQQAVAKAQIAIENVNRATERLADPQVTEDLAASAKALREILDAVAHKDSVAHRLAFDPEEAKKMDRVLSNLDATSANLAAISADARDMTGHVKSGPGLAHTVIYDEGTAQSVSGSLAELNGALKGVRTGNGLAHAVIYGDDEKTSQHVMSNLAIMSDDMREIVANMKAGRGTIGALLVDPSVYEDLKQLVGNVERNQVLRALVRYSIKQNESEKPHAELRDGVTR
jgi:phospholipid/cholesterol/gamma-HCH transport system substrate-binding protein